MKKFILYRPLSDMESDGVYFPDFVREEEICHYSGLPSLKMYMEKKETVDDEVK